MTWVERRHRGRVLVIWDPEPPDSPSARVMFKLQSLQVDIYKFALNNCASSQVYYRTDSGVLVKVGAFIGL
jgi:hypothetical protein